MSWLKAFSWKKTGSYEIIEMTQRLGVERRANFRINYPEFGAIGDLPTTTFVGNNLKIQNISTGGCAVIDPQEILGPAVGQEITLHFHWFDESVQVRCRIVSRVEERRHIQFLDMPEKSQGRIRRHVEAAYRGCALRKVESSVNGQLVMEACEIWVSMLEDSVTLFNHPNLRGSCLINREDFLFYDKSMPVFGKDRKKTVPLNVFDTLVLFLANVPNPSAALTKFAIDLGGLGKERFR